MKYNHLLFPIISLGFLVWGCFFANPLLSLGQQPPNTTDAGTHHPAPLPNFVRPHELLLKAKQTPELTTKGANQTLPQITVWLDSDTTKPNLRYQITDADGNVGGTVDPSLEDDLTSKSLSKMIFDFNSDITVVQVGNEVAICGKVFKDTNHVVSFITHCRHPNAGGAFDVDWYP